MGPASGLLIRVAEQSVIKSGFFTMRPVSGFESIDNNVARQKCNCSGACAGIKAVPAIW